LKGGFYFKRKITLNPSLEKEGRLMNNLKISRDFKIKKIASAIFLVLL